MTKLLENIKISTKIISLLLMMAVVTMFVAWNGSQTLTKTDKEYSDIVNESINGTILARAARDAINMRFAAYQAMAYKAGTPEALAGLKGEQKSFDDASKGFAFAKEHEPQLRQLIEKFEASLAAIHALTQPAAQYGARDQDAQAMALLTQADAMAAGLTTEIKALNDSNIARSNKRNHDRTKANHSTSTAILVISVITTFFFIGVAFFVSRSGITAPLARLKAQMGDIAAANFACEVEGTTRGDEIGAMARAVRVFRDNGIAKQAADAAKAQADAEQTMVVDTVSTHLSALSAGDLTATIQADFPGHYVALKSSFNQALGKLRDLIGAVIEGAVTIRTGAGEIAQASEDLARRTESNAATLEETAAAVTQIDGRLKASAQAAEQTVARADQTISTVGGGRAVADEAVQAMGRVSDSAKGIDGVIEGLDKIAFQTRVLAMNAAVEAGRAGDAGRGFAVVADLVSALAMRAEEEAKRARDQLTITQTDIGTAVQAVTKVDEALANISGDVGQVHELLATMATANQAQASAITEISAAISMMDQSTQQNAAMVEQTSAAARNLTSEVGELAQRASLFNVSNSAAKSFHRPDESTRPRDDNRKPYASPVKALPPTARVAMAHTSDDWNDF